MHVDGCRLDDHLVRSQGNGKRISKRPLPSCLRGERPASSLATVFTLASSVCPPRQASTDFHVTSSSLKRGFRDYSRAKETRAHLFGWKALRAPIFEVRQHLEEIYGQRRLHAHCKAKKSVSPSQVHKHTVHAGRKTAHTQLFRKLVVVAKDFHDGVQHPKAHRNLRLHLVDPLLSRRRVHIKPLQIRLGNRPVPHTHTQPSSFIILSFRGGGLTRKKHSRYLLMFDRE